MRTYVLSISYDGTNYFGWQKQPDVPTVQGELEECLRKLFSADIKTVGASRTDRGVHALGQVVSFEAPSEKYPPQDLTRRLNRMLPPDIAVNGAALVEGKFNARFDSVGKLYQYRIITRKDPFRMRYAYFLDISPTDRVLSQLNSAAKLFLGEHNFSAFSVLKDLPENPVCMITRSEWRMMESGVVYFVQGNRFLHKMVRALAGAIVEVVSGRLRFDQLKEMLVSGRRIKEFRYLPPQGLFLTRVSVPVNFDIS